MKPVLARGLRYAALTALVLPAAGVIYEQAARYQDVRRYAAPGQRVESNRH